MKRPIQPLLALHQIGVIASITINYRPPHPPHTPGAGTQVELRGNIGSITGLWGEYQEYLEVGVEWNSVARIKKQYAAELEAWWLFSENEKKELAELARLKKKFEKE